MRENTTLEIDSPASKYPTLGTQRRKTVLRAAISSLMLPYLTYHDWNVTCLPDHHVTRIQYSFYRRMQTKE